MFTRAITRTPGSNYEDGLTTVDLGIPDYHQALREHARYIEALRQCGLTLTELPADLHFPDGTFVEDTAILLVDGGAEGRAAIITRPGAVERAGETAEMKAVLKDYYAQLGEINAPGTLDGGDICEAGKHFFIGISLRTNQAGGDQLAEWLAGHGYTSSFVDIRQTPGILHLKSGIAYLGDNRLVVIDALAEHPAFKGFELVRVAAGEEYAANCIRVNDAILIAAGYPKFEAELRRLGYKLVVLEMSEFQKMDGGLSCLSLRF